ncbi:MAG TPA: hypothetical protein VMB34_16670 [Acetobacteraceae bacterium]|nr:hypothetical protein [Acetobacteraceae bacterium]
MMRALGRWLRHRLMAERATLVDAFRVRLPDPASYARLRQVYADGGVVQVCPLEPTPGVAQRSARVLLQLDGDVMLSVPRDFGAHAQDAALVTRLQSAVGAELQTLQSSLPYNYAALLAVILRVVLLGMGAFGATSSGDALVDWRQTLARIDGLWQVPPATIMAALAAVWHTVGIAWPFLLTASAAVGFSFGRALRLGLMSGGRGIIALALRSRH